MASEQKQTAEPWESHGQNTVFGIVIESQGRLIGSFETVEDRDRAVACVNALAGIADPAAFVKRAKAIERTMNDIAFGTQGHAEESDARVIDIITNKARAALAKIGGGA